MGCTYSITEPPEEAVGTWSDNNDRFVSIYSDGIIQEAVFAGARWVTERSGPIPRWETIAGVSTVESNPCFCCRFIVNDVQVDTYGRLLWGGAILMREQGPPRNILPVNRVTGGYYGNGNTDKMGHPAWSNRRNFIKD